MTQKDSPDEKVAATPSPESPASEAPVPTPPLALPEATAPDRTPPPAATPPEPPAAAVEPDALPVQTWRKGWNNPPPFTTSAPPTWREIHAHALGVVPAVERAAPADPDPIAELPPPATPPEPAPLQASPPAPPPEPPPATAPLPAPPPAVEEAAPPVMAPQPAPLATPAPVARTETQVPPREPPPPAPLAAEPLAPEPYAAPTPVPQPAAPPQKEPPPHHREPTAAPGPRLEPAAAPLTLDHGDVEARTDAAQPERTWQRIKRWLRIGGRYAMYAIGGYFVLVFALILVYRFVNPPASMLMLVQGATGTDVEQHWVPLDEISPSLIRAVIVSEDWGFCEHYGIDIKAIEQAIERSGGGIPRGASTISMQLTKNLFLWNAKSYVRKAIEVPLTLMIELFWPKWRILEVYLNVAEWGPGIFGAEAAAAYHFGKSAVSLNDRDAAQLAAALPNPMTRDAGDPGPQTTRKANVVQSRMRNAGNAAQCVLGPRRDMAQ